MPLTDEDLKRLQGPMNRQRILAEKDVLSDDEKRELRELSSLLTEAFCPEHKLDD